MDFEFLSCHLEWFECLWINITFEIFESQEIPWYSREYCRADPTSCQSFHGSKREMATFQLKLYIGWSHQSCLMLDMKPTKPCQFRLGDNWDNWDPQPEITRRRWHRSRRSLLAAMTKFFVCQSTNCKRLDSDKLLRDLEDPTFFLWVSRCGWKWGVIGDSSNKNKNKNNNRNNSSNKNNHNDDNNRNNSSNKNNHNRHQNDNDNNLVFEAFVLLSSP